MILSNPFDQEQFYDFIKDFLPDFQRNLQNMEVGKSGFEKIMKLGESNLLGTSVIVIRGTKQINSRVTLTNNSFKVLKNYSIFRALVVYLNQDDSIWRLSLLTASPSFDSTGKIIVKYSNPRRHSYVLGTEVGVATARKYLYTKGKVLDFDDLQHRFSVEAVNRDFYYEIAKHFYSLVGKYGPKKEVIEKPLLKLPGKNSRIEDLQNFSVRLLGRIIFVWFLRQKQSVNGRPLLPEEALDLNQGKFKSVLHDCIEPLFFEILNKPQSDRAQSYKKGFYGEVPYLNGGLFHPGQGPAGDFYVIQSQTSEVQIPNRWFEELFDTLNTYNFTIDENLENDIDLSIDPEMLGRVFENLLAEINPETGQVARKSTGSYYTPRAIVNFIVDESLKEYLLARTDLSEDKLNALLSLNKEDDFEFPLSARDRTQILEAINGLKVLDPACGSGAFPIGMLQKLLWIVGQVDPTGAEFLDTSDFEGTENWFSTSRLDYLRKRKIIRDVIFGTDIQTVAVEIAKLRCFLTLIVDQEIVDDSPNRGVVPLPNLDFKFICADSLIPLDKNLQIVLGDDPDLENKLAVMRKRYFTTTSQSKKERLRNEFESLLNSAPTLFEESKRNRQLKSFHPLALNNQAEFFEPKTMFGFEKFPVIIGNPPYKVIAGEDSQETLKKLKLVDSYEYALGGRLNLYRHFIERAVQMLAEDGVLSFIVPSTLIADKNTSGIRRLFRECGSLKFLIEFPEKEKVFESVTQATTIFLFAKSQKFPNFSLAIGLNSANLPPTNSVELDWQSIENLFGTDLTLPMIKSRLELDLIRKIRSESKRLDAITNCWEGEMNQTFKKKQIKSSKTDYLFVRGEHLSSYHIDLSTENSDRRWFDLREVSEPSTSPRLACQGVSNMGLNRRLQVAYIPKGIILGNSLNYIDLPRNYNYKVLLALLNSSLINWYFKKQSTNNNVNVYEMNALPIRFIDGVFEREIISIVEKIEKLTVSKNFKEDQTKQSSLDLLMLELDLIIYKAYGLEEEEIRLIEAI
jgi:adenine-specific DNA-methyltransferase